MIVWKEPVEDKVKRLEKKIEDLEGALEGAQNIVRQLRDAVSSVKEPSP